MNNMYNHSIESGRLSIPNHHKYSLRQRQAFQRPSREFTNIITQNNSQSQTLRQDQKNQTPTTNHEPKIILPHKEERRRLELNCFQGASQVLQHNQLTQNGYQGFYRTPSTNNSLQNQTLKPIRFEQTFTRVEGFGKYSLKNIKKNSHNKSNSRLGIQGFRQQSDQCHQTETVSQQPSIDQRITQQRNSQVANASKFSLKNGIKRNNKPQVLLSLKYCDLACLKSYNSSSLFSISNLPSKGKSFCNLSRFNDKGCKCDPQCLWMNRWLVLAGEIPAIYYPQKRSQKEWQDTVKQIERDLPRTQPNHQAFKSYQLIEMMREVLIGYAQLDSEVGYVQGMNFVAAALVYHSYSSFEALKVFYHLMRVCGYRKLFLGDLSFGRMLAKSLSQQLRRLVFDLFTHLVQEGIDLELFASSWYFSLCGSFVPLQSMHFLLDKFIKKGFSGINQVLLTLLLRNKENLLEQTDSQLMIEFSNQKLCEYGEEVDWPDLISRSERVLLSPIQH